MLARLRVRTPKVRRIMHEVIIISRRTCQFEIDGCVVQQRNVCPSPVPQAVLGLLYRFLVLSRIGIISWQYFTLRCPIASSNTSMAVLGPGSLTLGELLGVISVGGGS